MNDIFYFRTDVLGQLIPNHKKQITIIEDQNQSREYDEKSSRCGRKEGTVDLTGKGEVIGAKESLIPKNVKSKDLPLPAVLLAGRLTSST
jgi:hypothetical protein